MEQRAGKKNPEDKKYRRRKEHRKNLKERDEKKGKNKEIRTENLKPERSERSDGVNN